MDFDALLETGAGKENGPDRRIGHLGFAGLPLHGEPDFMRDLGGQAVKGEGGDEADDAMGGEFGHVDEIDFRGEAVHLGKLIETPGGGDQRPLVAEAVQGSPVDPLKKGLTGPDDPSLFPDGIDGFCSCGIHGKAWCKNVGKMSSLPTLFDHQSSQLQIISH